MGAACPAGRFSLGGPGVKDCTNCNPGRCARSPVFQGCKRGGRKMRLNTGPRGCVVCFPGPAAVVGGNPGGPAAVPSLPAFPPFTSHPPNTRPVGTHRSYANVSGTASPTCSGQCDPGQYSLLGFSSCLSCPAGTFGAASGLTSRNCTAPCPAGQYSLPGAASCSLCPLGQFGVSPGLASAACRWACPCLWCLCDARVCLTCVAMPTLSPLAVQHGCRPVYRSYPPPHARAVDRAQPGTCAPQAQWWARPHPAPPASTPSLVR
jgi:hypothetical protein